MLTIKDIAGNDEFTNDDTTIEIKWRNKGEQKYRTTYTHRLDINVISAFMNLPVHWLTWNETTNTLTLATRGQPDDWYKEIG